MAIGDQRSNIIIIGVGNRWRGDDGAGPYIAEKLAALSLPGVQTYVWESDCSGLLVLWSGKDVVYIVDAVNGLEAGSVLSFDPITQPIPCPAFESSSHEFGVDRAIELARALGRLPSEMRVYGVAGKCFEYGIGLSDEVEVAAMRLVEQVRLNLGGRSAYSGVGIVPEWESG